MLSDQDVNEWLSRFDESTQETLAEIQGLEDWPVDDDEEVQAYFCEISELVNRLSGDEVEESTSTKIINSRVTTEDFVKLQGQLGYTRAIKLFGDICYLSQDAANEMLSFNNINKHDDDLIVSSSLLARRVYLLIKINLYKRIFSTERQALVLETLKNQFDLAKKQRG